MHIFSQIFVYHLMLCYFLFFFMHNVFKGAYRPDGPGVKSMLTVVDITIGNVYTCHYE